MKSTASVFLYMGTLLKVSFVTHIRVKIDTDSVFQKDKFFRGLRKFFQKNASTVPFFERLILQLTIPSEINK